jgi:hypothetical protein
MLAEMVDFLQSRLAEEDRRIGLLGNAIQKAKFELSFAGNDTYVIAAMDALKSVYEIQHPELAGKTLRISRQSP